MNTKEATDTLRRLANCSGNETMPNEDVIDLAQSILALFGMPMTRYSIVAEMEYRAITVKPPDADGSHNIVVSGKKEDVEYHIKFIEAHRDHLCLVTRVEP